MELIIEDAKGVPDGGILSLKVGDTKRQGLAAKLGSPFRFASSPATPLAVKVELLAPLAPPQFAVVDPESGRCVVDFGGGVQVTLLQREVQELRQPKVDVEKVVEKRNLPSEKLVMAQSAAKYLEKHDIVQTFHDVLHGLLVGRPEDPLSFINDHLSRAKVFAAKRQPEGTAVGELPPDAQHSADAVPQAAETHADGLDAPSASLNGVWLCGKETVTIRGTKVDRGQGSAAELRSAGAGRFTLSDDTGEAWLEEGGQRLRWSTGEEWVRAPAGSGEFRGPASSTRESAALSGTMRSGAFSGAGGGSAAQESLVPSATLRAEGGTSRGFSATQESAAFSNALRSESKESEGFSATQQSAAYLGILQSASGESERLSATQQAPAAVGTESAGLVPARQPTASRWNSAGESEFLSVTPSGVAYGSESEAYSGTQHTGALSFSVRTLTKETILEGILNGSWVEGAQVHTIRGTELHWANGVVTDLTITGPDALSVQLYGNTYEARLEEDGQVLRWCDGDVWVRSAGGSREVEALLGSLQALKKKLPLVMQHLPQELQARLMGPELENECWQRFTELNHSDSGRLAPEDLLPVIRDLSRRQRVSDEQCRRFANIFEANGDGMVQHGEFTALVRFSLVAGYMESEEGKKLLALVESQDQLFQDFLRTLEQDWHKLDEALPLLPTWLQRYLESEEFVADWTAHFDKLDEDGNGVLGPLELIPEVIRLSKAHPLVVDINKCKRFAAVFNGGQDGLVQRQEFLELAKLLTVMSFLAEDVQGVHAVEKLPQGRAQELARLLEEDRRRMPEVLTSLPKGLTAPLTSHDFVKACREGFCRVATDEKSKVRPSMLFPVVINLCQGQPFSIDHGECLRFAGVFDKEHGGAVGMDEFVDLARFLIVMSFLAKPASPDQQQSEEQPLTALERAEQLLRVLQADAGKLGELVVFLPASLKAQLLRPSFAQQCLADFDESDSSSRGVLAPAALLPAVVRAGSGQPFGVNKEQCEQFLDLLSPEHRSAIRRAEYVSFVQFLLAMAFFETEEGQALAAKVQLDLGRRRVQALIAMLERDRAAVHKVVTLLPRKLSEHLAGGDFARSTAVRFAELDRRCCGCLSPSDLAPMVTELSLAPPVAVDEDACQRFLSIFDTRQDGVMHEDEFLELARFLCIMSFLHSQEGAALARESMDGSLRVNQLLAMLRTDRHALQQVLPFLPGWLRRELRSDHFASHCLQGFGDCDVDGIGLLEYRQLFTMMLGLLLAQRLELSREQCVYAAAIFDERALGVIARAEFPNFVCFTLALTYLQSRDGLVKLETAAVRSGGSTPSPVGSSLGPALLDAALAAETGRMSAHVEQLRSQAELLELENEAQREHILGLEEKLRRTSISEGFDQGGGLQLLVG